LLSSLLVSAFLTPVIAQNDEQIDLSLERHLDSLWPIPSVGDYVRYEITVRNIDSTPLANKHLEVILNSNQFGMESGATFSIPALAPGANVKLHVGPFKIRSSGENSLLVFIEKQHSSPMAGGILTYPGKPDQLDSFVAINDLQIRALVFGLGSLGDRKSVV